MRSFPCSLLVYDLKLAALVLRRRRVLFEWLSASARCDASLSLTSEIRRAVPSISSVAAVARVPSHRLSVTKRFTSHCYPYAVALFVAAAAAVVDECSDTAVFARTHRLLWGELLP